MKIPRRELWEWLDYLATLHGRPALVLSGGASGTDAAGEQWAEDCRIEVERHLPDWDKHGRSAGPIRNREMAQRCTAVALAPGGRGTASMRSEAHRAGRYVFMYPNLDHEREYDGERWVPA